MPSTYTVSDTQHWCPLCNARTHGARTGWLKRHLRTKAHRAGVTLQEMHAKNFIRLCSNAAVRWTHWLTKRGLITKTHLPKLAWIPNWVGWLFDANFYSDFTKSKEAVDYLLKDPNNLTAFLVWVNLAFEGGNPYRAGFQGFIDYFAQRDL